MKKFLTAINIRCISNEPIMLFKNTASLEGSILFYTLETLQAYAYKGKNVVVFGTYNLNVVTYTLYTKAIYPESPIDKVPDYEDVLVRNNDYSFYNYTSSEYSEFSKIQLWKVGSELIQVIVL